jgi:Flp pilus assembly pilin Flp
MRVSVIYIETRISFHQKNQVYDMFFKNEAGVTSIEYALMGVLIAVGVLVSLTPVAENIYRLYEKIAAAFIIVSGG